MIKGVIVHVGELETGVTIAPAGDIGPLEGPQALINTITVIKKMKNIEEIRFFLGECIRLIYFRILPRGMTFIMG